jgi:hypothetical protein
MFEHVWSTMPVIALSLAAACAGSVAELGADDNENVSPVAAAEGTAESAAPATQATAPVPLAEPAASGAVPAATPAAVPEAQLPEAPLPAAPPMPGAMSGATPAPSQSAPAPAMPGEQAMPNEQPTPATPNAFDAGSGTMQPDGKTVVFHIPDGTGGNDWNAMANPIRVRRGMTVHLIDDDTTKSHQLHTLGQPCSHGNRPIGEGFDCVVRDTATLGLSNGVYDHNGSGGRGRLYIEVVE